MTPPPSTEGTERLIAAEAAVDWNAVRENEPPRPISQTPIEVYVVAKRCVYVNDRRIAGGKPYVSENLPSHTLKTTIGEVLDAFTEAEIRAALKEAKRYRDYYAAIHARKAAA